MKLLIGIPVATFVFGFTALWLSAGALINAREHDLCWARASCQKVWK